MFAQRSGILCLASFDYRNAFSDRQRVFRCITTLLSGVVRSTFGMLRCAHITQEPKCAKTVEGRRNAFKALNHVLCEAATSEDAGAGEIASYLSLMISGLQDYSVDQRGDVGSWVRIACLVHLQAIATNHAWIFEQQQVDQILGICIRQSIDNFDSVREAALLTILSVVSSNNPRLDFHGLLSTRYYELCELLPRSLVFANAA